MKKMIFLTNLLQAGVFNCLYLHCIICGVACGKKHQHKAKWLNLLTKS